MRGTPEHDPCRWHSRAGVYLFGDTPLVADPRQPGAFDTALINAHEQTHRDLVNNTVYGYVLRRLHELEIAPGPIKRRRDRLMTSLSSKIWKCAEGSATAIEAIIAASPRSGTTVAALNSTLTLDYRDALAVFQPVCDYAVPFPAPFDGLARICLVHAAAECAADHFVFHETLPPEGFWTLAYLLDNTEPPDEQLLSIVQAASQLPVAPIALLFDQYKQLLAEGHVVEFSRNVIFGLKLAKQSGSPVRMRTCDPFVDSAEEKSFVFSGDI